MSGLKEKQRSFLKENIMFKGSIVALVTPFSKKGQVDEDVLAKLVEFHIKNGTDGIVPCGKN